MHFNTLILIKTERRKEKVFMSREMLTFFRTVIAMICGACLLVGCSTTTKLRSPLPIRNFDKISDEVIGLYIPEESKHYVWRGNINVTKYNVEFGNALEANAKHALSKIYSEVVPIDHFPLDPLPNNGITRALSLEIARANVSPGGATFSTSSAELQLRAELASDSQLEREVIVAEGKGDASPGAAGCIPLFFINNIAYNKALQKANEQAMAHALDRLIDAIIEHDRKTK